MSAELGGFDPLRRALDVVNALAGEPEPERDRAALTEVLTAHGERDVALAARDVTELRAAAGSLRRVLEAEDPDTAAALINDLLTRGSTSPRLSNHDGHTWHLHLTADDAGWADWLLAGSALAFALLLTRRGRCEWGRCAAGCGRYYVHDGRGSSRRYCSSRCAGRERVAAHRRRAADQAG